MAVSAIRARVAPTQPGDQAVNTLVVTDPVVFWASSHFVHPLAEKLHVHTASIAGSTRAFNPRTNPAVEWQHAKVQRGGRVRLTLEPDRSYVIYVTTEDATPEQLKEKHSPWDALIIGCDESPPSPVILLPVETPEGDMHGADVARSDQFSTVMTTLPTYVWEAGEHSKYSQGTIPDLGRSAQQEINMWAINGLIDGGLMIRKHNDKSERLPYGSEITPTGIHHWHFPFGAPIKKAEDLAEAIANGKTAPLDIGEIVMLSGDFYPSIDDMINGVRSEAKLLLKGYAANDALAYMVLDALLFPAIGKISDRWALKDRMKDIHDKVQESRKSDAAAKQSAEALKGLIHWNAVKTVMQSVLSLRGKTLFAELHALAQIILGAVVPPKDGKMRYSYDRMQKLVPWFDWDPIRILISDAVKAKDKELMKGLVVITEQGFWDEFIHFTLTNGQYADLALNNGPHFSIGGDKNNWEWFEEAFEQALRKIHAHVSAGNAQAIPAEAVARVAFGLHFLTDAFSAGHLRVPRAKLTGSKDGETKALAAKLMHDFDGFHGLKIRNGLGARWTGFGDKYLDKSPESLDKGLRAVGAVLSSVKAFAESAMQAKRTRKTFDLQKEIDVRKTALRKHRPEPDEGNYPPLYSPEAKLNTTYEAGTETFGMGFELSLPWGNKTLKLGFSEFYFLAMYTKGVTWADNEVGLDEVEQGLKRAKEEKGAREAERRAKEYQEQRRTRIWDKR
jgi:hypothetical protein